MQCVFQVYVCARVHVRVFFKLFFNLFILDYMLNALFVIKNNIIHKHEFLDPTVDQLFNE